MDRTNCGYKRGGYSAKMYEEKEGRLVCKNNTIVVCLTNLEYPFRFFFEGHTEKREARLGGYRRPAVEWQNTILYAEGFHFDVTNLSSDGQNIYIVKSEILPKKNPYYLRESRFIAGIVEDESEILDIYEEIGTMYIDLKEGEICNY